MAKVLDVELLTVEELAEKMHCSVSTVWRAVHDEGLPAFRISARCVRFDWTSVSQWLLRKRRVRQLEATEEERAGPHADAHEGCLGTHLGHKCAGNGQRRDDY